MRQIVCSAALLFAFAGATAHAEDADTPATRPSTAPETVTPARPSAVESSLRSAMRRPVSVDLTNEPLDRAVAGVCRRTFVPIQVDWAALEVANFERTDRVTLHLDNVPADHVLSLLFLSANRGNNGRPLPTLSYDAGGVRVTMGPPPTPDAEGQASKCVEVAYDVSDLVRLVPRWFDSKREVYDDLTRLVEDNVASDTWADYGGLIGRIRVGLAKPQDDADANAPPPPPAPPHRPGAEEPLVVTTTPELQPAVAELFSKLRCGLAGQPAGHTPAYNRTVQTLARPVPAGVKVMPLEAVLESWRRSAHVNLFVDWNVLAAAGIDRTALLTVPTPRGGTLPAGEALAAILKAAGGDTARLAFETDSDGVVTVSTADAAGRNVELRCYNVGPLLTTRRPTKLWAPDASAATRMEAINKLIVDNVDPDSWKANGGTYGSIRAFGWALVVTQTPGNQEKVAALLRGMP